MATSKQDIPSTIRPCRKIALVSGCTMKEYDQFGDFSSSDFIRRLKFLAVNLSCGSLSELWRIVQVGELISDLKKENFSLKLRIYYMDERLQQTFGDGHDVLKMNVQLQTEIDSLKQELIDKQVLIQKAAFAIETLTADRGKEEETIRNRLRADHEKELAQLRDQLDKANQSNDLSNSEVDKARKEMQILKQQLNDTTRELAAAVKANEDFEKTLEEMKLEQKQKDALLDRYKRSVEGLVKTLQQKSEECEGLRVKVDEGGEQIQVLRAELAESQLQNSKLHDLSLKQLHDMKLLMDFLHKEMKSLAHSSQQLKDNTGEGTNLNVWLTEAESVQRVYQKLQKLVENNSHLYQTLMFSVQARQEHSDSVESSSHCGHNKLEPILQIPGCGEVSSSSGKEQSGLRSLVQTSAETGKSSAQSGVVSSLGNVSDSPPAGSSMLNEVNPDDVDRFLQSDVILSNINWWLQMPARLEIEGQEKLVTGNKDTDLNHAQKPQSHPTNGHLRINISSVDLVKDSGRDNPEVNISGVSAVEELKNCIQEMVSGVKSSENLIRGNQEKINVPSLPSHEELKSNPVGNLRKISEIESVTPSNVIAIPTANPNCSKCMAADSREELFGTYSQSLDNFHKFQHAAFFDEDHYDLRRHDRASSMKFDSENATLTGRTASEHMTSTQSSHWSTGDSHANSSRICDTASLSQVEEAQNGGQPAEVDQNIVGTQQLSNVDANVFDKQHLTDVNQNMLGCQDNAHLEVNIQIKDLEEKLKATENTVKLLSRKNKVYLSALKDAGVCVNFMNRSNSESYLGSPSASSGKKTSSVGSLSMLTPGRNNESIERPRSFICDTLNQTGDVTRGSLDASIIATPSRTSVSLVDDTTGISEMSADILNFTTQSCTGQTNPAVSENSSCLVGDHASNTNSNNHNTSYVGNDSASFLTLPASPTASLTGSMRASPYKHPHDVSLLSEGHHCATPVPNCLNQFDGQDHTSMDRHVGSHDGESFVKPCLNMTGVSEKGLQEVTYSSIVDGSWMDHWNDVDGSGVTQGRHRNVTFSSIVDTTMNHGVKSNMDMSGVSQDRHPDPADSSIMDNTLTNHEVKTDMDMSDVSPDMHPDVTCSNNMDHTLINDGNSSNVDKSGVSRGRSPDVTFSSIMNGSLMNRLLNNLEHSLSALKDDTWNSSDLSVGQLRNQVEHLERVNLALKEEIRVYETLHCLQTSQTPSDKSSRQSRTEEELPEENLLRSYSESKSQVLSEEDLLRQYLIEIRKIRQRLEKLDLVKDPDQLLISQAHTHQRILHQETVIAHLQQLVVEKETLWQQEISELQHKLSREKVLAVEKLEGTISQLQTTVREQAETIREQEKQIVDFKLRLEQSERSKHKEEEMMKEEKPHLEGHLMKLNTTCVNGGIGLDMELEAKQKEIERLKMELGKEKESWRNLKEIVVKRERSLQEKILALQKLTSEKVIVEDTVKEKEAEIRRLELELGSLREKLQRMKAALEERETLVDKVEFLKEELRERENQEVRFDFQKMRYDAEIEKITEEKVKLSLDLETESREKERLKLRLSELEHKFLEKVKLEHQNNELKGEIKSLVNEVDKLNTKLSHRVIQEMEMRNRLRKLGETESQVSMLREQLLKCEDNLRVAEQLRDGAMEEVKEMEERLKKRNEQLHHLLQQYKKLEAAFIKQKSKLKEKTELLQKLKKQIHLYEHSLTCSSDQSLNDTNLILDSENYSTDAAAFTSTPAASPPVKQHSDSMSVKHCRRQLTYSAADIQPSEARLLASASGTCCPVAVLTRDCHQRLHKKTEQCLFILTEIESRLCHRLEVNKADSDSQNKESSLLRETYTSCQRLDNCLREAASWISSVWITELPDSKIQAPNYHPVMDPQNGDLRTEIQELPSHGTILQSLNQQQSKLYKTQTTWEKTLYKQLFKTTQDLERTKGNINAALTSLPHPPLL